MAASTSRVLRSDLHTSVSVKTYIGCTKPDVPAGKLASVQDVLQVQAWHREQAGCSRKAISHFCCNVNTSTREGNCVKEAGCVSLNVPCLLRKIKLPFLQAGIITISDWYILQNLKAANTDYQTMLKIKDRQTESAEETREQYKKEICKTFDITDKNAIAIIGNDQNRSERAKREDLRFYEDYFGDNATRSMMFVARDARYDASVDEEEERQRKTQERKEAERERERRGREENELNYSNQETGGIDEESDDSGEDEDEDWGESEDPNENTRKRGKHHKSRRHHGGDGDDDGDGGDGGEDEGDVGRIPYEILSKTSATALRLNLSPEQHVCILAAFLKCSEVDLANYPISHSTAVRRRKKELAESYAEIRRKFQENIEVWDDRIFVHLDTKALADTIGPRGAGVSNTR